LTHEAIKISLDHEADEGRVACAVERTPLRAARVEEQSVPEMNGETVAQLLDVAQVGLLAGDLRQQELDAGGFGVPVEHVHVVGERIDRVGLGRVVQVGLVVGGFEEPQ